MRTPFLFQRVIFFAYFLAFGLLNHAGCNRTKNNTETLQKTENESPAKQGAGSVNPDPSELAEDLLRLMKLAETQNAQGKFDEALSTWRTIHRKVSKTFGIDAWQTISAEHAMNTARQGAGMSGQEQQLVIQLAKLTGEASRLVADQKYHEAQIDIEKAAGISIRLWGKESYVSANVNFVRAQCYLGLGFHERAIAVLSDVLNLRITLTGVNHPDVESTLALLAKSNSILKNHTAAQQSLEKLVEVSRTLWGEESEIYANRCNDLAVSYHDDGKSALSLAQFDRAHGIRYKIHGADSIQVGHVQLNRGIALLQMKNFAKGKKCLADAYRIFHHHKLTDNDRSWPVLLDQLGTLSLIQKENKEGQKYFAELTELWKKRENETHLEYGKSLFKLSVSIGNQGKYKLAEPKMKCAIAIFESNLGYSSKLLQQPRLTYSRLLAKMGVQSDSEIIKDSAVRPAGFKELPK